jgi:16S rRNA (guanine527-N7)-methyltransferase
MTAAEQDAALLATLDEARALGFLGPGPVARHVAHARGFAWAVDATGPVPSRVLDLGSGGGIPGLVLAVMWPSATVALVDAGTRRTDFLRRAVERCQLSDRVTVVQGRAEALGRTPELRGAFQLVVARSFGPPAVTAECAAPFLEVGGALVVSERPASDGGEDRWDDRGLGQLGLGVPAVQRGEFGYAVIRQDSPCPDRFPRRVGVPQKRPLF